MLHVFPFEANKSIKLEIEVITLAIYLSILLASSCEPFKRGSSLFNISEHIEKLYDGYFSLQLPRKK
jgi:hypothetical protein